MSERSRGGNERLVTLGHAQAPAPARRRPRCPPPDRPRTTNAAVAPRVQLPHAPRCRQCRLDPGWQMGCGISCGWHGQAGVGEKALGARIGQFDHPVFQQQRSDRQAGDGVAGHSRDDGLRQRAKNTIGVRVLGRQAGAGLCGIGGAGQRRTRRAQDAHDGMRQGFAVVQDEDMRAAGISHPCAPQRYRRNGRRRRQRPTAPPDRNARAGCGRRRG